MVSPSPSLLRSSPLRLRRDRLNGVLQADLLDPNVRLTELDRLLEDPRARRRKPPRLSPLVVAQEGTEGELGGLEGAGVLGPGLHRVGVVVGGGPLAVEVMRGHEHLETAVTVT